MLRLPFLKEARRFNCTSSRGIIEARDLLRAGLPSYKQNSSEKSKGKVLMTRTRCDAPHLVSQALSIMRTEPEPTLSEMARNCINNETLSAELLDIGNVR